MARRYAGRGRVPVGSYSWEHGPQLMARWRTVGVDEAARLERELQRELPDGHALHGRAARAVARRDDCDDVAFDVEGFGLCIVHLTWRGETDPRWPHVEFVETLPTDEGE